MENNTTLSTIPPEPKALTTGKYGNNTFSKPIVSKNQELGYADTWLANKLEEDFQKTTGNSEMLSRLVSDIQQEVRLESKLVSSNEAEVYKFRANGFLDENAYTYQDSYSIPAEVKEVLARFGSNTDQDFVLHNAIGDSMNMPSYYGTLILDETGNYRIGIYDYVTANKLADPDGTQLEFLATNQAQIWAATQKYMSGRNLLKTSPSWSTTTKEVPLYSLNPDTGAYQDNAGNPLKLATVDPTSGRIIPNLPFDPQLFPNPTEVTVTPDMVLYHGTNPRTGKEFPEAVAAKDAIPMVNQVERFGLEYYLGDTEHTRSMREYNLASANNWSRFGRWGDYGSADKSVGIGITQDLSLFDGWIDSSTVPLVDAATHWLQGFEFGGSGIDDPRVVAKKYTPSVSGEEVYNLLLEDKKLAFTLTLMGVDLEKIKGMKTSGEVFGHINGVLIQNGVSKAIQTRTAKDGWFMWAGRGVGTLAYHTLVAGDAVGQIAITVLTGGAGVAATGAKISSQILSTSSKLSTMERIAAAAAIGSKGTKASKFMGVTLAWGGIEGFGRSLRGINSLLPVNFAEHTISGIGRLVGLKKSTKALTAVEQLQQTSKIKRIGSWLINQSLEGFLEEGVQEFAGQTIDLHNGVRATYDPARIWANAYNGLWAEPLLGGVLYGPSKGQNWVFGKLIKSGLHSQARLLGLNPARVIQMEHYMGQFYGSYDNMTEEEKTARTQQVMRMVIVADSLEKITVGNLVSKEESTRAISMLIRNANAAAPGSGAYLPEALANMENLVEELNADYGSAKTGKARREAIDAAIEDGTLVKKGGKLYLATEAAEDLAALLAIEHTNPRAAEQGRIQYLQNKYERTLSKVEAVDRDAVAQTLGESLEGLLKALSLKSLEMRDSDFASPEVQTEVSDSIEVAKSYDSSTTTVSKPKEEEDLSDEELDKEIEEDEKAARMPPTAPEVTEAPTVAPTAPEVTEAPTVAPVNKVGGFNKPAGMVMSTEMESTLIRLGEKISKLDIDQSLKNKIITKINGSILKKKGDLVKLQTFLNSVEANPRDVLNAC